MRYVLAEEFIFRPSHPSKPCILYLVHNRELVPPYQTNINKRTDILLNCHFINNIRNFSMFQTIKSLLQGV